MGVNDKTKNHYNFQTLNKISTIMNASNMKVNGEWGKHARPWLKKKTAKKHRTLAKQIIRLEKCQAGY